MRKQLNRVQMDDKYRMVEIPAREPWIIKIQRL